MRCSGCSALHLVNPNLKKKKKENVDSGYKDAAQIQNELLYICLFTDFYFLLTGGCLKSAGCLLNFKKITWVLKKCWALNWIITVLNCYGLWENKTLLDEI